MSERKRVGHVGAVVADNIQRLREEKNLSRPDLARRINELHQEDQHSRKGWELSPSKINALAITRIENGERRVDVDDLVLFAAALDVAVPTLLMPYFTDEDMLARFTAPSPHHTIYGPFYWGWLTARNPLGNFFDIEMEILPSQKKAWRQFFLDSLPTWSSDFEKIPPTDSMPPQLLDVPLPDDGDPPIPSDALTHLNKEDDPDSDDQ